MWWSCTHLGWLCSFFKLHSKNEYFERQAIKSIVILVESFFVIAMLIFYIIFNEFH